MTEWPARRRCNEMVHGIVPRRSLWKNGRLKILDDYDKDVSDHTPKWIFLFRQGSAGNEAFPISQVMNVCDGDRQRRSGQSDNENADGREQACCKNAQATEDRHHPDE